MEGVSGEGEWECVGWRVSEWRFGERTWREACEFEDSDPGEGWVGWHG